MPHIEQKSIVNSCGVMFSGVRSLWLITLIQIKLILNLDYDFISLPFSRLSLYCLLLFFVCHAAITVQNTSAHDNIITSLSQWSVPSMYVSSTGFTQAHKPFRMVCQSLSLHLLYVNITVESLSFNLFCKTILQCLQLFLKTF